MRKVLETAYKKNQICSHCNSKMVYKVHKYTILEGIMIKNLPYLYCNNCGFERSNTLINYLIRNVAPRRKLKKIVDFNQIRKWL